MEFCMWRFKLHISNFNNCHEVKSLEWQTKRSFYAALFLRLPIVQGYSCVFKDIPLSHNLIIFSELIYKCHIIEMEVKYCIRLYESRLPNVNNFDTVMSPRWLAKSIFIVLSLWLRGFYFFYKFISLFKVLFSDCLFRPRNHRPNRIWLSWFDLPYSCAAWLLGSSKLGLWLNCLEIFV